MTFEPTLNAPGRPFSGFFLFNRTMLPLPKTMKQTLFLLLAALTLSALPSAVAGTGSAITSNVTVDTRSAVATLAGLALNSGTVSPAFASGTLTYSASVPNATSSVTVTPTVTDAMATVKVNGTTVASGIASGAIALNVGANTITTVVTAQDGTSTQTYTVVVTRLGASAANLFAGTGSLATGRYNHSSTVLPNGKVLVVGGVSDSGVSGNPSLTSAELYDPAAGTWSSTGPLNAARSGHTASLLPNGKVLVVGGGGVAGVLASAELYDPATGTWRATGSMANARSYHTTTVLNNGKLLVAGGYNGSYLASAELYDPATGAWSPTGALSVTHHEHTATLLANGKVLVAAGRYDNYSAISVAELYDPSTGTWSATASLASARYFHTATLMPNGKVLVAGGYNGSTFVNPEIYDPAAGTWSSTAALATNRFIHTASLLPNGKVLVSGGSNDSGQLSTSELYDPATGVWSGTGALATARAYHTATLLPNGKLLIVGGWNSGVNPSYLASAEVLDSAAGSWGATGSLASTRISHTSTLLPNGKVLVAGGSSYLASAELFDPAAGSWAATGSIVTGRAYHTATLLSNGMVLVAGGGGNNGYTLVSAELYDPASGTWHATGSLAHARAAHMATLLPNGKVLVVGGSGTSAELYDPATGIWSATGSLTTARDGFFSTTLLPSGKVLVVGGLGGISYIASAELYDPVTGTWTATGSLATAREAHTATLLPNGKVFVAGGYGSTGNLASAELYDPATGTWNTTGSLANVRSVQTATLLPNGKVLVAGGDGSSGVLASAELYEPATGTCTATGALATARRYHTATILPNGKVLIAAGFNGSSGVLASAELYDVGMGFSAAWQPTLTSASCNGAGKLILTGNGFRGISSASGGNGSQDSPSNYPLVQLRRLDNEQSVFLLADPAMSVSATAFTSVPVSALHSGYALATVFANGIPSAAAVVALPAATSLSSNANLSGLTLSTGDFSPAFASATTYYSAAVSNSTSSLTLTPTLADANATVKVNDVAVASGSASGSIHLNEGTNTLNVLVTAQDGSTLQGYTVVVTRAVYYSADLGSFNISARLIPGFDPTITDYTVKVPYSMTSIDISAMTADFNARLMVMGASSYGNSPNSFFGSLDFHYGGSAYFSMMVTAADYSTFKTYNFAVIRETAYETWFWSQTGSYDAQPNGDLDHDGVPNLMEYALGLDPWTNSSSQVPQGQLIDGNFVISFTEPIGVSGITYGAEWSPTMVTGTWQRVTDSGSDTTHTFSVPTAARSRVFMRLTVTEP